MAVYRSFYRMMKTALFALVVCFISNNVWACSPGQITYTNGGTTECKENKFQITTVPGTKYIGFTFYAAGTYYVDCNVNDTNDIVQKVSVADTTSAMNTGQSVWCDYTDAGEYTIGIGGEAINYIAGKLDGTEWYKNTANNCNSWGVFKFINGTHNNVSINSVKFIKSINGQLGHVFPTISGKPQPTFYGTFSGANNLTNIPGDLLSGINGTPGVCMFSSMFSGTGIENIPLGLFSGISGTAKGVFVSTFSGAKIKSIDPGIFRTIKGPAQDGLFANMFMGTSQLKSLPENIFGGITKDVNISSVGSFRGAFQNSRVEKLPNAMFDDYSNLPDCATFKNLFAEDSALKGYIPYSLLESVHSKYSNAADYTSKVSSCESTYQTETGPYNSAFVYTGLTASTGTCPSDMYKVTTYFDKDIAKSSSASSQKLVCSKCPAGQISNGGTSCQTASVICTPGKYLSSSRTSCDTCPSAYPNSANGSTQKTDCYATVTYVLNNGEENLTETFYYSDNNSSGYTPSLPTPNRDDYVFVGWNNENSQRINKGDTLTGNRTLTAQWSQIKCSQGNYLNSNGTSCLSCSTETNGVYPNSIYDSKSKTACYATMTFHPNNGTDNIKQNFYYTDSKSSGYTVDVTTPSTKPSTSSNFSGWYQNSNFSGSSVSSTTVFQGNKDLYAKWEGDESSTAFRLEFYDQYHNNIFNRYEKYGVGFYETSTFVNPVTSVPVPGSYDNRPFIGYYDEYNNDINDVLEIFRGASNDTDVIVVSKTGLITAPPTTWHRGNTSDDNETYIEPIWGCQQDKYISNFEYINNTLALKGACNDCPEWYTATGDTYGIQSCYFDWECPELICPEHSNCSYVGNTSGRDYDPTDYVPGLDVCRINFTCNNGYIRKTSSLKNMDYTKNSSSYFPVTGYDRYYEGIDEKAWRVDFSYGSIEGTSSCNALHRNDNDFTHEIDMPLATYEDGNCWCKITHFKPNGSNIFESAITEWFLLGDSYDASAEECGRHCAADCADYISSNSDARRKMYATAQDYCSMPETGVFRVDIAEDDGDFGLSISAAGTFYVDWGDGNTTTVNHQSVQNELIRHYYEEDSGNYTITIWSDNVKGYSADTTVPAVRFNFDSEEIVALHGSLGNVFPTLNSSVSGTINQPSFMNTFYDCEKLENLPNELFNGIYGTPVSHMFDSTFESCYQLNNVTGQLFPSFTANTVSNAEYLFNETFLDCDNLESISSDMFAGISGAPSAYMFDSTFDSCDSLENVPQGLFRNIRGDVQESSFQETFYQCGNLTSVPADLLSGLTGKPKTNSFNSLFDETSLEYFVYSNGTTVNYIPPTFFASMDNSDYESGPMSLIFDDTNIATSCESGMYQYITGFEEDEDNGIMSFDGHVSCAPCVDNISNVYQHSEDDNLGGRNACYALVTYNTNGGTSLSDTKVYYNDNNKNYYNLSPIPITTKTDKLFSGWHQNSSLQDNIVTSDTQFYNDVVLFAAWQDAIINLKYSYDNTISNLEMCSYNERFYVQNPQSNIKPGYRFMGWIYKKVFSGE